MADPLPSPPSTPPPHDPKPPTPATGKSPNKRKSPTVAGSPSNKRPNRDIPPSTTTTTTTADINADTSTGKQKVIEQNVDVDDIEVLNGLLDYHSINGVFPFENPADMKNFLRPWLILRYGNEEGWKTKLEQVKTKFTKASNPIEDGERKEFDLWMKIWGNEEGGDDDDRDQSAGS